MAVAIPQDERKIAAVSLEKGPKKTVYKEGEKLDLRGGTLRVQYEGGQVDELINLTHSGVTVSGYDAHQKGEQNLTLQYLGLPVSGDLKVQVTGQDEGKPKEVAGLYITKKPKTDYLVGNNWISLKVALVFSMMTRQKRLTALLMKVLKSRATMLRRLDARP